MLYLVQEHIFQSIGVPLVKNALAGYNTTLLSFGQVISEHFHICKCFITKVRLRLMLDGTFTVIIVIYVTF